MTELVRRITPDEVAVDDPEHSLKREWLVTNGLGGYASGTLSGVVTRRYHGLLIAALPAPYGRMLLLSELSEQLQCSDGSTMQLGGLERSEKDRAPKSAKYLAEFRLEYGLPVWEYRVGDIVLERRVLMPHLQNTVHVTYTLRAGADSVLVRLRPALRFRSHDDPVSKPMGEEYVLTARGEQYEISAGPQLPVLRITMPGVPFTISSGKESEVVYPVEESRGYDYRGELWAPGHFTVELKRDAPNTLIASCEPWEVALALSPEEAQISDFRRRKRLLAAAPENLRAGTGAELVLAADQFIITPTGRPADRARAHAAGDEVRTVIAGYHWFTDWGRDTMISLEGLTLTTGRHAEAEWILRTFSYYIRDGLIPNMFPEGGNEGLYHTADATLWFFHALNRYLQITGDRQLLAWLLPKMIDIIEHHKRGTRFHIGMDPDDALLRQGEQGYQLTWMDAKVGDWVVTPRRGKAVEINALWYNALRLLQRWVEEERGPRNADPYRELADRARESFNRRFWYAEGNYLYDVVDGENGDDAACRPNQIFSFSLDHPVLEKARWKPVLQVVHDRLLTPVGLRSLAPGHPDYKARYFGDLRTRDAAYHQGTTWAWLIGPFVDAWLRVYADDYAGARRFLDGCLAELGGDACIGSISEIFDAEKPFAARGCIAQAWSVAEVLRSLARTEAGLHNRPELETVGAGSSTK